MGRQLWFGAIAALAMAHEVVWAGSGPGIGANLLSKRQASTRPSLSFNRIGQLRTCEKATIEWTYTGPPINLTLEITNRGVGQTKYAPVDTTLELSHRINPTAEFFDWPAVNVSAGDYQFVATIESQYFETRSPFFLVEEGDFSCLTGVFSTGTSVVPAETLGAVLSPGSSLSGGAIAGVVVGVLAFLILSAIGIFFVLRRRKREVVARRQAAKVRNGHGPPWTGGHSTNSSVRTVVGNSFDETDKYGGYTGGSRAESEKGGVVAMMRKESVTSYESAPHPHPNPNPYTYPTSPSPYLIPTSPSQDHTATESSHSHNASTNSNTEEKRAQRQSFGPRKRKPAPVYTEDLSDTPSLPVSNSSTPNLTSPSSLPALCSPAALTPPVLPAAEAVSQRPRSATIGHYSLRTNVESRPSTADGLGASDLMHKSSFGPTVEGKQLHYLMPDLPMGHHPR